MTCTWLLVISGTASIGTWVILQIPAPIMVSVSKPIRNLLLIEKSMILLIIENVLIQLNYSIDTNLIVVHRSNENLLADS
ncbi:hypothetical protein GCM10011368_14030 [Hyunsoonleella pacifica]|nr:hypothetical protein GCM10011368_14030 [Hyunsoonleella pacifica]